jgi:2-polyprenyl-3-methyl-5-hydroxy-6-metoxy-1,4-benzoquinol methylase
MTLYKFQKKCRLCNVSNFKLILDLGKQPPSNAFLPKNKLKTKEQKFPLRLYLCKNCFHLQLRDIVDKTYLFSNYFYMTGVNKPMVKHFQDYSKYLYQKFLKKINNPFVIEIGSNDGTLLKNFLKYDVDVLGIEPAKNLAKISKKSKINTISSFFNLSLAEKISKKQKADIIVANNVLGHVNDLDNFIAGISLLLKDNGIFIFEVPHSYELLKKLEFDTIYHEHISYFSIIPLQKWFKKHKLEIFNVKKQKIHGGTIRVFVSKQKQYKINKSVNKIQEQEEKFGIKRMQTYDNFLNRIELLKKSLRKTIFDLRKNGYTIFGYGSPAKGNVLLNYCNLDNKIIDFLIDVTPLKQNKYTPGTHIPIKSSKIVSKLSKKHVGLLLAWNYKNEILIKEKQFRKNGGKFLLPIPKPTII